MVRRSPRGTKQPSRTETDRAQGVLLEQIASRMDQVLEAVNGTRQHLDEKIDSVDTRLTGRIDLLTEVVRENSRDIRKNSEDIRKNSVDICSLRETVTGLRHDFDHREEVGRVGALEARVSAIETRLASSR